MIPLDERQPDASPGYGKPGGLLCCGNPRSTRVARGAHSMDYVGQGSGDYIVETRYKYIGPGGGEFRLSDDGIDEEASGSCACFVFGLALLLAGILTFGWMCAPREVTDGATNFLETTQ